ncbi:MAG: Acetyltransferase YpeA [Candidatus Heimdallarchaeota archaeon LC_3]|nr:MAG: Acetyltransferase YpeA [Candidatus Heimdallarchaeota archaeon LC_3]
MSPNYVKKIRKMTRDDIPYVRKLWAKSSIDLTLSDDSIELEKMISQNEEFCLVCEIDTIIISAVLGGFDGRRGWVHHLAVDPNYRRQQIGTFMMEKLMEKFIKADVVKVKLEILKSNIEVVEFYKQLNWDLRSDLVTMSYSLRK